MKKPIIVTVDDDAEVLQAISHDIRREYGERFRIIRVDSGDRALDVLRQVQLGGRGRRPVARRSTHARASAASNSSMRPSSSFQMPSARS